MNDRNQQNPQPDLADGLAASMQGLATHAEALLQSTSALTGEGVAAVRQGLADSLGSARAQLLMARDQAVARGKQIAGATDGYVHEKPWQAIAIAALFGVIVGFMSRGTRR